MAAPKGSQRQNALGRFTGSKGLTEMQRAFVLAYVANGGLGQPAAEAAGYQNPRVDTWRLLKNPTVQAAIREENARLLETEGTTLAVGHLLKILRDDEASPRIKLEAAKTVLDRAGMTAHKPQGQEAPGDRDLADMPLSELAGLIDDMKGKLDSLQNVGPVIDVTPETAPNDPPPGPKLLTNKGSQ